MTRFDWNDTGYFNTEKRDLGGIRRVLAITMVLNFAATGIKLAAGISTGALSVVADGLDSLFDGISNVIGLVGLYIAAQPPDAEHPYGHRKFETVAALSIAVLLFLTSWQLLVSAYERLTSGMVPEVNQWTVAALVVSIAIQAGTSFYELRAGRRMNSEVLVADALHTRASILVSLSVLGGLGLLALGFEQADALLAGVVALVIAKIGVDVLRETLPVLVDQAAVDPQVIARVAGRVEGVESVHRVRSRGAMGSAAVDLHLQVAPENSLTEANAIADEVRRRLLELETITDVTVHLEAQRASPSDAADVFATLRHAAKEHGLVVHEAWVHSMEGDLAAELHVGVDPHMNLGDAHAQVDRFERAVRDRLPHFNHVHTHIELASTDVQQVDQVSEAFKNKIRQEVDSILADMPALRDPHNLIVRRDPAENGNLFISLECTLAPETPMTEAHELATTLERELSRRLEPAAEVSVHLEPPDEPSTN